jgi:hypothetical protein|uniref:Uncharacterized protein n=1 Tax=viral metagenome TaxID=1070528 RepID=A0A6C0F6R0_9ZZZZ|tara:strand:- start:663 stop:1061 length:399 start_codon:yes stop_codon:yes gene_type:complete
MDKNKKFIYKTFNNEFILFLDFLINSFKTNDDIKTLKTTITLLTKYNPIKLIYLFNYYVTIPYDTVIQKGDYEYFENKDYSSDVTDLKENAEYVLKTYDNMRKTISKEPIEKKKISMKFIQNLSSLSKLYYS